jgi:hypothetical protein
MAALSILFLLTLPVLVAIRACRVKDRHHPVERQQKASYASKISENEKTKRTRQQKEDKRRKEKHTLDCSHDLEVYKRWHG